MVILLLLEISKILLLLSFPQILFNTSPRYYLTKLARDFGDE